MSSLVSNSISGGISFAGLGSETDFGVMVEQLKKIEEIPKTRMTLWKSEWEYRVLAMEEVLSAMSEAKTTLSGLNSMSKMLSLTIDSSDDDVATASISPDSNLAEGNYSIDVKQVATPSLFGSNKVFTDKDTVINDTGTTQSFSYTYKGTTREISCPSGTTLETLVTRINNDAKNPGVSASLLKNGDGYMFQIQSKDTGEEAELHIDSDLAGFDSQHLFTADDVIVNKTGADKDFTYHYNGKSHTVNVTAGMTAKELVDEINGSADKIGLKVGLKLDGSNYDLEFKTSSGTVVKPSVTTELANLGGGGFAAADSIINSTGSVKTYNYTHLGESYTIQMADGETLTTLADKINDKTATTGVTANVVQDPVTGRWDIELENQDMDLPHTKDEEMTFELDGKEYSTTIPAGTTAQEYVNNFNDTTKRVGSDIKASISPTGQIVYTDDDGIDHTSSMNIKMTDQTDTGALALENMINGTGTVTLAPMEINPGVAPLPGLGAMDTLSGTETVITDVNGSISFDHGGSSHTVNVPAGTTLSEYATIFNAESATTGVKAVIVNSASGYSIEYQDTTTNKKISLEKASTDIEMLVPNDGNWHKQESQDAKFYVNGWPQEFTSASNTVSEVVIGMDITIKTEGKTTLSVVSNPADLKEHITEAVDAINLIKKTIMDLSKVDTDKQTGSPDDDELSSQHTWQMGAALTGNYGVQMVTSRLNSIISSSAPGFTRTTSDDDMINDLFTAFSQLGISTVSNPGDENFGLLEIDYEELDKAIAKDSSAVAELFSSKLEVTSPSNDFVVVSAGTRAKAGTYDVDYTIEPDGTVSNVIINGSVAQSDPAFPGRFTVGEMENNAAGIALQFNTGLDPGTGDGKFSSTINSKQGKINEIIGFLDDELRRTDVEGEEQGTLPTIISNYSEIMDNIQNKIDREIVRVAQWEKREKLKFSRLDVVLQQYNSQGQQLAALMEANS